MFIKNYDLYSSVTLPEFQWIAKICKQHNVTVILRYVMLYFIVTLVLLYNLVRYMLNPDQLLLLWLKTKFHKKIVFSSN